MKEKKKEIIKEMSILKENSENKWINENKEIAINKFIDNIKKDIFLENNLYNFHFNYWNQYGKIKFNTFQKYIEYIKDKWKID